MAIGRRTIRYSLILPGALLAMWIGIAGCVTPAVDVRDRGQALATFGPPDSCDEKQGGETYCAWTVGERDSLGYARKRVVVFDSRGRVVKSYFVNFFSP